MNNLILLGKIFNMLIIFYLIYKIILKRKYSYLNTFFCFLIIFLSLVCVLLINSLSYNIFIFLILIITFLIIDNIPDKFEFEKTSIIIRDGRINFIDLLKNNYSLKKFFSKIRSLNINKISSVDLALLDREGSISFYVKSDNKNICFVLIMSGRINYDVLKVINKDTFWLNNELDKRNILMSDVIYAFNNNNLLYIIKK